MQTILQLDGPVSVWSRSRRRISENVRIKQESVQRTTASHRREYPGKSSDDIHNDGRSYRDQRPPERGRYQGQNGRLPDRRNYQDRGYSGRGYANQGGRPPDDGGPPDDRGPLMIEDPLIMEDTLMLEDPLMMKDLQEMDDILDALEDEDNQDLKDLLDL